MDLYLEPYKRAAARIEALFPRISEIIKECANETFAQNEKLFIEEPQTKKMWECFSKSLDNHFNELIIFAFPIIGKDGISDEEFLEEVRQLWFIFCQRALKEASEGRTINATLGQVLEQAISHENASLP